METLEETWEIIKEKVLHPDSSDIQINEMKKAFYAGAGAMIQNVIAIGDNDSLDDDAGVEVLNAYVTEVEQYFTAEVAKHG